MLEAKRRLAAALLVALSAASSPGTLRAMTAQEFEQLSEAEQQRYFWDMIAVAKKVLIDAGREEDVNKVAEFPNGTPFPGLIEHTGWTWFVSNLTQRMDQRELAAIQDPAIRRLEVEFTFFASLRDARPLEYSQRDGGRIAPLPAAFLEIAKAGAIHSTALAMRQEEEPEEGDYDPAAAAEAAREFVQRALAALGPQRVEVPLLQIADFTPQWGGKTVIATGTVSHTATISAYGSAYEHFYFEGAGDRFVVCFGDGLRALGDFPPELRAMKDPSELVGKTVVVAGYVDGPVACRDQDLDTVAAMELRQSAQIRLIKGGSGTAARAIPR